MYQLYIFLIIFLTAANATESSWSWLNFYDRSADDFVRIKPSDRLWGTQCSQTLFDIDMLEGYNGRGIMAWEPNPNTYLFMQCGQEKISMRIQCILNHMLYAGLLNRTLVVAMDPKEVALEYDYSIVFDVDHFRRCYGPKTLMTTREYQEIFGRNLTIDQIFCWSQRDGGCPIRSDLNVETIQNQFLPRDGLSPALQRVTSIDLLPRTTLHFADLSQNALLEEFFSRYSTATGDTIILGEMLHTKISHQPQLYTSGDLPFFRTDDNCPNSLAVQPHRAVIETAKRYVKEVSGKEFIAVHIRRGELISSYCNFHGDCHFPIPQLAECVKNKLLETNISTIFLATDGNKTEISLFVDQVKDSDRKVRVLTLSNDLEFKGWAQPLVQSSLISANEVEEKQVNPLITLTLEKVISAYSSIFMGSIRSTFTTDIERLRYGLGTANCEDRFICDSEPPWEKNDFRLKAFQP